MGGEGQQIEGIGAAAVQGKNRRMRPRTARFVDCVDELHELPPLADRSCFDAAQHERFKPFKKFKPFKSSEIHPSVLSCTVVIPGKLAIAGAIRNPGKKETIWIP
jgi:hypothetical protein